MIARRTRLARHRLMDRIASRRTWPAISLRWREPKRPTTASPPPPSPTTKLAVWQPQFHLHFSNRLLKHTIAFRSVDAPRLITLRSVQRVWREHTRPRIGGASVREERRRFRSRPVRGSTEAPLVAPEARERRGESAVTSRLDQRRLTPAETQWAQRRPRPMRATESARVARRASMNTPGETPRSASALHYTAPASRRAASMVIAPSSPLLRVADMRSRPRAPQAQLTWRAARSPSAYAMEPPRAGYSPVASRVEASQAAVVRDADTPESRPVETRPPVQMTDLDPRVIDRLTDDVIRRVERRARIERERRGM